MSRRPAWWRPALGWGAALLLAHPLMASSQPAPDLRAGEAIYLKGTLPNGQALRGERAEGVSVQGRTAACVSCHRHSGFGAMEGTSAIPPITGQFLFQPRMQGVDNSDLPYVEGSRGDREPYTRTSLARAIRDGVGSDGRSMSYLMPHYALGDADLHSLVAYLDSLTKREVPGVTDSTLHFATIITPDVDAARKAGFLEVMNKYFIDKNAAARAVTPRLRSGRQMRFRTVRRWELHVWELKGPASGWQSQLNAHLAAEPVFAVLSGLAGSNWAPVHRFCQDQRLPCLFPNVELPVVADDDFYSLYFSKSVLLDAGLIANQLPGLGAARRLVQVFRAGDIGESAAQALAQQSTLPNVPIRLEAHAAATNLRRALAGLGADDVLVLWLRPRDIAALAGVAPPPARAVFLSGVMGEFEAAPLPAAWRTVTQLAYPVDLPARRRVRVDFAQGWFRLRQIRVTDLPMQAQTYLALGLVSETLNRMSDSFVRDYLVERIEGMIEHRIITGYYPHLALAQGQRFASKGGYLVHFTEPAGTSVAPEGPWIVP